MNESLPIVPQTRTASYAPGEEIDLRTLVEAVGGGRWTVLWSLVLALLAGLFYYWAVDPMYQADALVQVEKKNQNVSGAPTELYEMMSGRDSMSTEIELIKSRMVLGRVIDQLRLDIQAEPRRFPLIGAGMARQFEKNHAGQLAGPLLNLERYGWGGERIEVTQLTLPDALQDVPLRLVTREGGRYELQYKDGAPLALGKVGEPSVFLEGAGSIFVRDLVANPGAEFKLRLDRRLDVVQDLVAALKVMERGKLSSVLSIAIERKDAREATAIVNAIANAYQRQNVERRSAEAEQTLAFVNEQLPRVQKDLVAAENALNSYRLAQKSADLTKETELVLQQSVTLEGQRLQLQQKREEALRKFTGNHPVIQALDGQLKQLQGEQESLASRVKGLPETQQELLRLSRDVEVNNSLYTALLSNAEQLRIAKAGTIGNVRVVDLALQPHEPARPKLSLVLGLSAFIGVFLGLVAVFVRRAMHQGVSDPAVLERQLHLPTYATIPYSPTQSKIGRQIRRGEAVAGILALREPSNPSIEAIRSLRTALHVAHKPGSNNIIMVCGPAPALGKSFVSVNLAASLAMTGRRVVLVDADMRRGQLHLHMGGQRSMGLSDFLNGRCSENDMVQSTPQQGLFLVPTGAIPDNPSELLLAPAFDKAVQWLSQQFDYVIMDTAPVLIVADAVIAGRHAGTTLAVLKSGQHSLREIEDTLKRLKTGRISVSGVVLNQVSRGQLGSYGADTGYYHYDYRPAKN